MVAVPLGRSAYARRYAGEPEIEVFNRFFETNPANQVDGAALLSRPGTKLLRQFGAGFTRSTFTRPGAFDGDLFVVMGDMLYRLTDEQTTAILGELAEEGTPSMAVMVGVGYEYLFIADGTALYYYPGPSSATGVLEADGAIGNGDTVKIGVVHYQWVSGDVNAGTQAGTLGEPYLVALAGGNEDALANLGAALNRTGTPGTDYSSQISVPHLQVEATGSTAATLNVRARVRGTGGNAIATEVIAGANLEWSAETLENGGLHALHGVPLPDDNGMKSVASLAGYVIAVEAAGQRFYWILPGETTIDPLNFASAEAEPDRILEAQTIGDQVWFFGETSIEAWYASGDGVTPFLRTQGSAFSRGVVEGTPVRVNESVVVVGNDGRVYRVDGGGVAAISNHGIDERIRVALRRERENG